MELLSGDAARAYRNETRRQRYNKKLKQVSRMPVSVACINFSKDTNIAYVVRAAACFSCEEVNVIGSVLSRDLMNDLSGSTFDYMSVNQFARPEEFVKYCRDSDTDIVSFEMPDINFDYTSLDKFKFDFSRKCCVVVGNETTGVPVALLAASKYRVHIKMPGVGYSLNTSQTANVALYEARRQFDVRL